MAARFISTSPVGFFPAGLVFDVIELTCERASRQVIRVRYPGGQVLGTFRTIDELCDALGITTIDTLRLKEVSL